MIVLSQAASIGLQSHRAEGVTYRCRGPGALLSLPHGGHREDAIQTTAFKKYIRDHVVSWFNWSRDKGLPVERMEDLVLVYGCTLVTSWAAAAFDDYVADAQISLTTRALNNGGTSFHWANIRGVVEYHGSQVDPICSPLATCTRSTLIFTFPFSSVLKESLTHTQEPLRLHQVLPRKTHLILYQTHSGCGRTHSRQP